MPCRSLRSGDETRRFRSIGDGDENSSRLTESCRTFLSVFSASSLLSDLVFSPLLDFRTFLGCSLSGGFFFASAPSVFRTFAVVEVSGFCLAGDLALDSLSFLTRDCSMTGVSVCCCCSPSGLALADLRAKKRVCHAQL